MYDMKFSRHIWRIKKNERNFVITHLIRWGHINPFGKCPTAGPGPLPHQSGRMAWAWRIDDDYGNARNPLSKVPRSHPVTSPGRRWLAFSPIAIPFAIILLTAAANAVQPAC